VDLNVIREAVTSALENEGHHTAAALLSAGNWTESASAIQVEVAIKKTMLGLTMNAEAEKITRNALRAGGFSQRFNVISSETGVKDGPPKPTAERKPVSGGAQGRALSHPLVQQAQELFGAEVRSVMDLSEKS
jgi:DNA polymerase-3 subunit gamma/tau